MNGRRPLTAREQRIWRAGLLKGAELALDALSTFRLRLECRGMKADPPVDFEDEHPAAVAARRIN